MRRILDKFFSKYVRIFSKDYDYVLYSYIILPFYFTFYKKYMLYHQNRREAIAIYKVFKNLGLNFLGISYKFNMERIYKIVPKKIRLIFGIEPNFEKLSYLYPEVIKVYYATGAYYKHQNRMIINRTDEVNRKRKSNISYYRLVNDHKSVELADFIVQIGTNYTIQTYPEQFKKKIKLIRQSSFEFLNYNENLKKEKFEKNVFLWFGGRGAILKGLDLVLEYFSKNKDLVLHVVGPVEEQFCKVYEKELFFSSNIYFHGYLPVYSEKFLKIANEASFIILPSASEGGIPGSVINALRLGMIPIVSKYAAMDDIMEYGFLIESLSAEGIEKAVKKSLRLSKEDILNLFRKNYNFVSSNFNIKTFSSDFESVISDIIKIDSK